MVLTTKLEDLSEVPIRTVDCFEILKEIGAGTHGQVYKAREKASGEIVALKRMSAKSERAVLLNSLDREITILKKLDHRNVINLKEIVTSFDEGDKFDAAIYMVFEYMDHDLEGLIGAHGPTFTVPQIKYYMKQLLEGLDYCHTQNVLHLDIKGANLLVDDKGTLKIADFGCATSFSSDPNEKRTNRVMTLWFKPPELILGCVKYGPEVDMWSVGCVFGWLLKGGAILTGKNECFYVLHMRSWKDVPKTLCLTLFATRYTDCLAATIFSTIKQKDQLNRIFDLCGAPDVINLPDVSKLPYFDQHMRSIPAKRQVREMFKNVASDSLNLLDNLLTLDPSKRWTAKQALHAKYFSNGPPPSDPKSLPKYESVHFDTARKKKIEQQQQQASRWRSLLGTPSYNHQGPPPVHYIEAPVLPLGFRRGGIPQQRGTAGGDYGDRHRSSARGGKGDDVNSVGPRRGTSDDGRR